MFTKGGLLDQGLEGVGETIGQVGKSVKNTPQDLANQAAQQLAVQQQKAVLQQEHGATNNDIVNAMYGIEANQHQQQTQQQQTQQQNGQVSSDSSKNLSPEEQQKLQILRKRLHDEYYQKLIQYEHKKPEPRPQEEEEKEKEQKKQQLELQKKEEKKEIPINMRPKGAGEVKHGVGG